MESFEKGYKYTTLEKVLCSVQSLSCVWLFATPWTAVRWPPCPSPTPGVHPNPSLLSQWCHPTISPSVVPFSSHLQYFPASGSFPMSQLFASGGQSIGVSPSTSVLPMNTQDWSPLEWTGWISFQSKGLSRVFSNTTVQKHQFFCAQLSLQGKAFLGLSRSEEGKKTVLIMELVVLCNGLLSSKRWLPKEIRTVWGN